jgi:hypothetical protein
LPIINKKHQTTLVASRVGVFERGGRLVRRFGLLLQRGIRQVLRDSGTNVVRFGVSALLALVVSTVYGTQNAGNIAEESDEEVQEVRGKHILGSGKNINQDYIPQEPQ